MSTYQHLQLDALGDPTRRAILARLSHGALPVGELAREFPITRPAISQHLRVLKQAHLVLDKPVGNRRLYQLDPSGFDTLRAYLDQFWGQALDAFARTVDALTKNPSTQNPSPPKNRSTKKSAASETGEKK